MANVLDGFIQNIKSNVPGFVAASVTEVRSGVSYGSNSVDPSFDPNLTSIYNLGIIKAEQSALQILGLASKERVVDILITLTDQIHIIDTSSNGSHIIYSATDSNKANLSLTRVLPSKCKRDLVAIL